MQPREWRGLILHEQQRGTLVAVPGRAGGQRWWNVTLPRSAIVALWPAREALQSGGTALVPTMSNDTPVGEQTAENGAAVKLMLDTTLLRAAYLLRVARWNAADRHYRAPSFDDDWRWAGKQFAGQVPRAVVEAIRKDLAPKKWKKPGPRYGEIWPE